MALKQFSLLLFLALNICHVAYSQEFISKGHSFIGGGIDLNFSENSSDSGTGNETKQNNSLFSFSPYYGKFIKDKLAIGVGLFTSYSNLQSEYLDNSIPTSNSKRKRTSIGASFFLRKYYPIGEKLGAFIRPSITYRHGIIDEVNNTIDQFGTESLFRSSEGNDNSLSLGASLGLYYFIAKRFSLEANLGNVFVSKTFASEKVMYESNGEIRNQSTDSNNLSFNFVNTLSFDQILVITYFF